LNYSSKQANVSKEYAAYAVNYISSLTSRNVSVIAWSQGNLDMQWAFKYWPSTRSKVSDLISLSPDFHGTQEAYLLCPTELPIGGCDPSISQQTYSSKFITRLRQNGGDSAYVPTTVLYSSTDEIVEPQSGIGASAYLLDARKVGVTNVQVQVACPLQPAGSVVTHEGMMSNALAFALAVDALTNPGPGQLSRINLPVVCADYLAPGLTLNDFLLTESKFAPFV
jgi:hypothetical protein